MKVFLWRHNRRFHSWSMMNEPNIHQTLYTDAVAIVQAETEEQALQLLMAREPAWVVEELRRLRPTILSDDVPAVIFADVRGD